MLDTEKFLIRLSEAGYSHLCVVPCSFATNIINASINRSKQMEYVPCASEAVACSVAAGLRLAGRRPIVIVQSSGLTNMGSCITSLLKPYGVHFPIIVSWRTYNLGDSEIQHAHLATHLSELAEAYGYEHELLSQEDEATAVRQVLSCDIGEKLIFLQKGTFSLVDLDQEHKLSTPKYPARSTYLKMLDHRYAERDNVFIGTTGHTAREMYTSMPNSKNFYMVGNMGGALSLGLGTAIAGRRVFVCGGDAEFVMHMGGLTTAGRYQARILKLAYIVFDNESNKSTGGQRTLQDHLDYNGIAGACNFKGHRTIESEREFGEGLDQVDESSGIWLLHVKASYDGEMARPSPETILESKSVFLEDEVGGIESSARAR